MTRVLAIDCDLKRLHCWDALTRRVVCIDEKPGVLLHKLNEEYDPTERIVVLFETGSPVTYGKLYMKRQAWMIYNAAVGMYLARAITNWNTEWLFLVAPSSVWTKSYSEKQRHNIAGVDCSGLGLTKDQRHNIGECQAMVYFYQKDPGKWKTYFEWLEAL